MKTKTRKKTAVSIPLDAVKCLYTTDNGDKIVCEINVKTLKKANKPNTIDEMVSEARIEYHTGKTKGFSNTKDLLKFLKK